MLRYGMQGFAAVFSFVMLSVSTSTVAAATLAWSPLPSLPDKEGFAGSFAGVSRGELMVAGGTNFPDKRPWEGGTKVWYDTVYALSAEPGQQWRKVGVLPRANGYGVSITTDEGVIVVGGGNATENFRDVYLMRLESGKAKRYPMPALPRACAFMTGARLGNTIYIAGGIETPSATKALGTFWALDLDRLDQGWLTLPSWPGEERILACMGSLDGSLCLCSGARLKAGADGKAEREWLKDAYRYTPNQGWNKIADLPRVAVAAPSPAPVVNDKLLVLGGDDGALVNFEPKDKHPGFPREILAYDAKANAWQPMGELPFSLVTSPCVIWDGRIIVPGGEARPGKRSAAVWAGLAVK
jgi:N-acetylneuraminic acid mutarotase